MKRTISTLAILATLIAGAASAETLKNADLSLDPATQTKQITEVITEEFADLGPQIVKKAISIADCESYGGRDGMIMHIDPSGRLVKNPKSSAAGVFQTLLKTHGPASRRMGLNLREVTDNVKFARHLVEGRRKRGQRLFADWVCKG